MDKYRILRLIPHVIVFFAIIFSVYTVSTTNISFGIQHYVGILGIVIAAIATIFYPKTGFALTAVVLMLGVVDIIEFTAPTVIHTFFLAINGVRFDFRFQNFPLIVFILFLIFNYRLIVSFFSIPKR